MSIDTTTAAHKFTVVSGTKQCSVCGKTRGAKAHKALTGVDKDVAAEAEGRLTPDEVAAAREADTAAQVAEAREDMLPDVSDATDDAEIADALAALDQATSDSAMEDAMDEEAEELGNQVDSKPEPKPAKKAVAVTDTASIWVGWRITNAAVLVHKTSPKAAKSLAQKLTDAKPTGDLDRTVKLTVEELAVLDGIAARFMEPGHTGPEQYSGRALRGRIAAALAKIESGK